MSGAPQTMRWAGPFARSCPPTPRIGLRVRALSTFTVIGSPACTVGSDDQKILSMFLKYSKTYARLTRRHLSICGTLKAQGGVA